MKKICLALFVLFFLNMANSLAQTAATPAPAAATTAAATDFFAGKWELTFAGTPQGDVKLIADLSRKDGKLTGELADPTDAKAEKIPISSVEETDSKITIYFSAQGYDLNAELEKVDDDNLKGMLMNMFESKAVRVKQ